MTGFWTRTRQLGWLAVAIALLQIAGPASALDGDSVFTKAMLAYEDGTFSDAETLLQAAAQEGYRQAHETLGMMYTIGPALFAGIETDRSRAVRHFEAAAVSGSVVSRYMLCALGRQPGDGQARHHACAPSVSQPPSHLILGNLPYESD